MEPASGSAEPVVPPAEADLDALLRGMRNLFQAFQRSCRETLGFDPDLSKLQKSISRLLETVRDKGDLQREISDIIFKEWESNSNLDLGWLDDQLFFLVDDGSWAPE